MLSSETGKQCAIYDRCIILRPDFTVLQEQAILVPDSLPLADAAVFPPSISTAASGLFYHLVQLLDLLTLLNSLFQLLLVIRMFYRELRSYERFSDWRVPLLY
jgi:hypothetical protein